MSRAKRNVVSRAQFTVVDWQGYERTLTADIVFRNAKDRQKLMRAQKRGPFYWISKIEPRAVEVVS